MVVNKNFAAPTLQRTLYEAIFKRI